MRTEDGGKGPKSGRDVAFQASFPRTRRTKSGGKGESRGVRTSCFFEGKILVKGFVCPSKDTDFFLALKGGIFFGTRK